MEVFRIFSNFENNPKIERKSEKKIWKTFLFQWKSKLGFQLLQVFFFTELFLEKIEAFVMLFLNDVFWKQTKFFILVIIKVLNNYLYNYFYYLK